MLRDFPWGEGRSVQFRAEAFNGFNITNFQFVKNTVIMNASSFGQLTSAASPRILQFALKVYF